MDQLVSKAAGGGQSQKATSDDNSDGQDLVEGTCVIDSNTLRGKVVLPPFERTPRITLWSEISQAAEPEVEMKGPDQFTLRAAHADLAGKWHWRARGKLQRYREPDYEPQPQRQHPLMMAAGVAVLLLAVVPAGVLYIRSALAPAPVAVVEAVPSVSKVRLFDENQGMIIPGSDVNGSRPQHTLK